MTENNGLRQIPANDLDLQMSLTNPAWQDLSPELKEKLVKEIGEQLIDGQTQKVYEKLSGLLGVYTRDIRLGNIKNGTGEMEFISYYLRLSVDLLSVEAVESSVTALNIALSILEPSSSRGGFLRKLLSTFITENTTTNLEPRKKSILGKNTGAEK